MTKNEIVAAYEDFDKIILDFSKEIGAFKKEMLDKSDNIMDIVFEIGSKWKANGYNDFKSNMEGKIRNIEGSLERCESLKRILEESSRELEKELDKLREKE